MGSHAIFESFAPGYTGVDSMLIPVLVPGSALFWILT